MKDKDKQQTIKNKIKLHNVNLKDVKPLQIESKKIENYELTQLIEIINSLNKENEYLKEQIKIIETESALSLLNFFHKRFNLKDDIEISISNSINSEEVLSSLKQNLEKFALVTSTFNNNNLTIENFTVELENIKSTINLDKADDDFFKAHKISTISKEDTNDIGGYKDTIQLTTDFILENFGFAAKSEMFKFDKLSGYLCELENLNNCIIEQIGEKLN